MICSNALFWLLLLKRDALAHAAHMVNRVNLKLKQTFQKIFKENETKNMNGTKSKEGYIYIK